MISWNFDYNKALVGFTVFNFFVFFVLFLKIQWRALDEIYAGVCDGMTYEEIKKNMPEEYEYVAALYFILSS